MLEELSSIRRENCRKTIGNLEDSEVRAVMGKAG